MIIKQRGFNLIELMIALVIGLVLMVSITTMFVDTKVSASRSSAASELQQQAQLALQILMADVRSIGSWGEFSGESLTAISVPDSMAIGGCAIGSASGAAQTSFPETANWISTSAESANCVSSVDYTISTTSDALSIARIQGLIVSSAASAAVAALDGGNYYVAASPQTAKLFIGANAGAVTNIKNANVYPYIHHAYFVETSSSAAPRLKRFALQGGQMENDLVVENIERIRIEFGIDSDANGIADTYYGSNNANFSDDMWSNNQIVAARIFVLARATNMDATFITNDVYNLGTDRFDPPDDDHYRRFLLSTTVVIKNNVMAVAR
jgi:type IV pilus assembly protein PilW